MKKIILFCFLALLGFVATKAQIVLIDPSSHDLEFLASDFTADATSMVTNLSGQTRTFRWVRTVVAEPVGWSTSVCDKNNCYPNTISYKDFVLGPDSSGLLKLDIVPNNISGFGQYEILVFDINDSSNANSTMIVNANASVTGIADVSGQILTVYPNPVKSVLNMNLDVAKHVTSVDIHNVVGQKIKTIAVEEGTKSIAVPVGDLKKGIYFLRVYTSGKELTTKTFSKE